jgi:hypothetical protein
VSQYLKQEGEEVYSRQKGALCKKPSKVGLVQEVYIVIESDGADNNNTVMKEAVRQCKQTELFSAADNTYAEPMLKMTPKTTFWKIGICRARNKGMGSSSIRRSVKMFKIDWAFPKLKTQLWFSDLVGSQPSAMTNVPAMVYARVMNMTT